MSDILFTVPNSAPSVRVVSTRNQRIGGWIIGAPFIGLLLILVLFAVNNLVLGSAGPGVVSTVVNIVLGFLGVVFVVAIFVCVPLGIVMRGKREIPDGAAYDERSGQGPSSVVPPELKGWNWGAAGLSFIWGLYHHVWLSLVVFVPLVNIVWWIVLGVKGNEWAWRSQRWVSVDEFNQMQAKWKPWGITFLVLSLLSTLIKFLAG